MCVIFILWLFAVFNVHATQIDPISLYGRKVKKKNRFPSFNESSNLALYAPVRTTYVKRQVSNFIFIGENVWYQLGTKLRRYTSIFNFDNPPGKRRILKTYRILFVDSFCFFRIECLKIKRTPQTPSPCVPEIFNKIFTAKFRLMRPRV